MTETTPACWHVYILRCADGTLYTGCTSDLDRRLRCHARKQVKYTRGRLPVELFYKELAPGRSAALRREAAIKKLRLAQKLALAAGAARTAKPVAVRAAPRKRNAKKQARDNAVSTIPCLKSQVDEYTVARKNGPRSSRENK